MAVACLIGGDGVIGVDDFLIVLTYNCFHVVHTAVAYFDVIFVKDFMKFVILGEVFVDELEEGFADVSLYVLAVWWVVPADVSLSTSSRSCGCCVVVVKPGFHMIATVGKVSATHLRCACDRSQADIFLMETLVCDASATPEDDRES